MARDRRQVPGGRAQRRARRRARCRAGIRQLAGRRAGCPDRDPRPGHRVADRRGGQALHRNGAPSAAAAGRRCPARGGGPRAGGRLGRPAGKPGRGGVLRSGDVRGARGARAPGTRPARARAVSLDPRSSAVVVETAAVRALFGTSLDRAWAPAVLASFGSGSAGITVRVVASHGAVAYQTALAGDTGRRQGGRRQAAGRPADQRPGVRPGPAHRRAWSTCACCPPSPPCPGTCRSASWVSATSARARARASRSATPT